MIQTILSSPQNLIIYTASVGLIAGGIASHITYSRCRQLMRDIRPIAYRE